MAKYTFVDLILVNSMTLICQQAERLKSRERRPEINRLDGQWAQWSIGLMVDRVEGRWSIGSMVNRLKGQ